MTTFRYKGISSNGAPVSGVVKSYNEYEAVSKLRESCSIITHIEEVKEAKLSSIKIGRRRIKDKELAIMCSQFAIILTSGLPIVRCVEMVAAQAKNKEVKHMLEKVAEDIDSGYSMAQSFDNHRKLLPTTFIETVRAGEQSGTLDACFRRLYKYYDKTAKIRAKIVSTLTYPAIVICVAVIVFIIIMVVAVPMFISIFEELGTQLPMITKIMIGISNLITGWWWLLLLLIAVFVVAKMLIGRTEKGKRFFSENKIKRTPLHKIHSMNLASQFANTMSTMLASGLPIIRALDITSAVVSNYTFSLAVRKVKEGVERGRSLADTMAGIEYFPKMLTEMTGVGERSGSLEETLDVIGEYFSNEVELASNRLLSILEPVITIVLAVFTVILLLAVYLPMFSMYGSM